MNAFFIVLCTCPQFYLTSHLPQFIDVHLAQWWIHLSQGPSESGTRSLGIMEHLMTPGATGTNPEAMGGLKGSERVGNFLFGPVVIILMQREKICL